MSVHGWGKLAPKEISVDTSDIYQPQI